MGVVDGHPCDDTTPHAPHVWRPDMHRDEQCPGLWRAELTK